MVRTCKRDRHCEKYEWAHNKKWKGTKRYIMHACIYTAGIMVEHTDVRRRKYSTYDEQIEEESQTKLFNFAHGKTSITLKLL